MTHLHFRCSKLGAMSPALIPPCLSSQQLVVVRTLLYHKQIRAAQRCSYQDISSSRWIQNLYPEIAILAHSSQRRVAVPSGMAGEPEQPGTGTVHAYCGGNKAWCSEISDFLTSALLRKNGILVTFVVNNSKNKIFLLQLYLGRNLMTL